MRDSGAWKFDLLQRALSCGRIVVQVFGIACVCIAVSLISATLYVYFHTILPLLVNLHSVSGIVCFVVASWISFNLCFNYVLCVKTAPGRPVATLTDEEKKMLENEQRPSKGHGWSRFCKTCQLPKPPRTHHCHICNRCVLKMDHHCPWINGCVGHYNHRYFALFLFFLWLACVYALLTISLHYFGFLNSGTATDREEAEAETALTFTFIVCLAVFVAMSLFLTWNTYLLISNQTTIEFHYNRTQRLNAKRNGEVFCNIYDVGVSRNLMQVFGPFKQFWQITLPSVEPLQYDGCRFLTSQNPGEDIV
eukprot:TRINITY_DN932_c1_g1_i1.p1 TRINITY_DN932_c1_g1~~TRINITY_DN932_c1_g1_i1.p1  ORF type:complete len:321 (-),score=58.71 TRINITY_DN932_c1_g1_i1:15-935(-)